MALHRVWIGQLGLEQALREGLIEVHGPDALRQVFPRLLKLSLFVERGREALSASGSGT